MGNWGKSSNPGGSSGVLSPMHPMSPSGVLSTGTGRIKRALLAIFGGWKNGVIKHWVFWNPGLRSKEGNSSCFIKIKALIIKISESWSCGFDGVLNEGIVSWRGVLWVVFKNLPNKKHFITSNFPGGERQIFEEDGAWEGRAWLSSKRLTCFAP